MTRKIFITSFSLFSILMTVTGQAAECTHQMIQEKSMQIATLSANLGMSDPQKMDKIAAEMDAIEKAEDQSDENIQAACDQLDKLLKTFE